MFARQNQRGPYEWLLTWIILVPWFSCWSAGLFFVGWMTLPYRHDQGVWFLIASAVMALFPIYHILRECISLLRAVFLKKAVRIADRF